MRRAPIALVKPRSRPDACGRGARHQGGLAVKADRNAAGTVSNRHVAGDALRWVYSSVLALIVVAILLLVGMLI